MRLTFAIRLWAACAWLIPTLAVAAEPPAKGAVVSKNREVGAETVLVGVLAAPDGKSPTDSLYTALVLAVKNGLEQGYLGHKPAMRVDSYDALIQRADMKVKLANHGYQGTGTLQTVLGKLFPLSTYVGLQLLKREKGFALQLSIFGNTGGEVVLQREKVITTEQGEDELLQLATEAGSRIALDTNEPPVVQVNRPVKSRLTLGQELVLDASASQDPDFDKLRWNWKQIKDSDGKDQEVLLGDQGSVRSILRLRPSKAGVYHFCLRVSDQPPLSAIPRSMADCTGPSARDLTVEVGVPPTAERNVSALLTTAPSAYHLEATCPANVECGFSQHAGPDISAELPPLKKDALEWPAKQDVTLTVPGLYKFQFQMHSDFGDAVQTWSIMVAPRPVPIIDAPTLVYATNTGILDASGSYDPSGQPLSYLWALEPVSHTDERLRAAANSAVKDPDSCAVLGKYNTPGIYITGPTRQKSLLRTSAPGKYRLLLQVSAPRDFDGHATKGTMCAEQKVEVVPRRFEVYLGTRGKLGGPPSEKIQMGVFAGGSVVIGGDFRFHLYQMLFRNAGKDSKSLDLQAWGGTHLDVSYEFWHPGPYFFRPLLGGVVRGFHGGGAGGGPRIGLDIGYQVSRLFVLVFGPAADYVYSGEDERWHPSAELAVSLGLVL